MNIHAKVPDVFDLCIGIHLPAVVISIQSYRRLQNKAKRAKSYFPRGNVTPITTHASLYSVCKDVFTKCVKDL